MDGRHPPWCCLRCPWASWFRCCDAVPLLCVGDNHKVTLKRILDQYEVHEKWSLYPVQVRCFLDSVFRFYDAYIEALPSHGNAGGSSTPQYADDGTPKQKATRDPELNRANGWLCSSLEKMSVRLTHLLRGTVPPNASSFRQRRCPKCKAVWESSPVFCFCARCGKRLPELADATATPV